MHYVLLCTIFFIVLQNNKIKQLFISMFNYKHQFNINFIASAISLI